MMMMKFFTGVLLVVSFSFGAFAATDHKGAVEGYVTAFDNNTVTIESGSEKIEIPRKFYTYKVKAGEKITVHATDAEIEKFKKESAKK